MFPSSPRERLRVRRWLFFINFIFIVAMIFVSTFAAGDFVSFIIHIGNIASWLYYVPWACVIDRKASREENRRKDEDERLGRDRSIDERNKDLVGNKWWIVDKAWHEVFFQAFQAFLWLGSAIFGGIKGGPQVCQVSIYYIAVTAPIDDLVDDSDIVQFCNAMTASIAISCVGFVVVVAWMWWTIYAIRSLRKDRKERLDGVDYIVKEKAWGYSMSELLRRHPEMERYIIKRYGGDNVEMSDFGSSEASGGSIPPGGSVISPQHRHQNLQSPVTALSPQSGSVFSPYSAGTGTMMTATTSEGANSTLIHSPAQVSQHHERPNLHDLNTDLNSPVTAYEGVEGEMAPPPYIRPGMTNPNSPDPNGDSSEEPSTSTSGNGNGEASSSSAAMARVPSARRPLPLVPGQVEQVVDRKMEEMASNSGTLSTGTGTSDLERIAMGLGRPLSILNASTSGSGGGSGAGRYSTEYPSGSGSGSRGGPSEEQPPPLGPLDMTMEQLVDRKINHGLPDATNTSTIQTTNTSQQQMSIGRVDPLVIPSDNHTWPGANGSASNSAATGIPPFTSASARAKALEAGFSLDPPPGTSTWAGPGTATSREKDEMTLEEMIERKLRSLKEERERSALKAKSKGKSPMSPLAVNNGGGISNGPNTSIEVQSRNSNEERMMGMMSHAQRLGPKVSISDKAKGKRRARAGSDPGPILPKGLDEESDED